MCRRRLRIVLLELRASCEGRQQVSGEAQAPPTEPLSAPGRGSLLPRPGVQPRGSDVRVDPGDGEAARSIASERPTYGAEAQHS